MIEILILVAVMCVVGASFGVGLVLAGLTASGAVLGTFVLTNSAWLAVAAGLVAIWFTEQ